VAQITVNEASEAYEGAMRNTLSPRSGICAACRSFNDPAYERCYKCGHDPETLDVIVPITYSVGLGQMHTALRNYKDGYGSAVRYHAGTRLAAILWRFLENHDGCIANAAGVDGFDLVTTVPSSSPQREVDNQLRRIVGSCKPIAGRFETVLTPTGNVASSHSFARDRYTATRDLSGSDVLLIDDTWTTGGNARSAGHALREAGASTVGFVAIGRHVRGEYLVEGQASGDLVKKLPPFDWDRCCLD
jgi:predicted amidophosphoribosyltransferase